VDESGVIRTQMGTHSKSEMVAVYVTAFAIPLRNSNSRLIFSNICVHLCGENHRKLIVVFLILVGYMDESTSVFIFSHAHVQCEETRL
jgi:hypothetical protein